MSSRHGRSRLRNVFLIMSLLVVSCGSPNREATTSQPAPSTAPPVTGSSTTLASALTPTTVAATTTSTLKEPAGFAYESRLFVVDEAGERRFVYGLNGEMVLGESTLSIRGVLFDANIHLVQFQGDWWDVETSAALDADSVELFLFAGNAILLPQWVEELRDVDRWTTLSTDELLGLPVTHQRLVNVEKDVDWSYGSLSYLDMWLLEDGSVVKIEALFSTGDNDGWPLAQWEATEFLPSVTIDDPGT